MRKRQDKKRREIKAPKNQAKNKKGVEKKVKGMTYHWKKQIDKFLTHAMRVRKDKKRSNVKGESKVRKKMSRGKETSRRC